MDENDLKAVSEAMNELRESGTLSADTLNKLSDSTKKSSEAQKKFANDLAQYGRQVSGALSGLASGGGSFKSLAGAIDVTATAISKVAGQFGIVGKILGGLATGLGEAAKVALNTLDDVSKNYEALGDASAGAADGIDGLYRQFNQLGNYSLPAFTKAVKGNTLGLAALQGTAAQGAEELSKVSGVLTTGNMAGRFLKLGISLDSVGDATTEYLATSARYGILQGATTEELTKKTQNYIEEVDKIARLTGQTREAQAKEAQKSLVDARFRAKLADMQSSGQGAAAEELRKYVEGLGGAAGDAARALVTGIPLTKEAAAANLFANDAIRQNTLAVQEGRKATEAIVNTQDALRDGTVRFGKQIMYAGDQFGGIAVQAYDTRAILESEGKTREERLSDVEQAQNKQATASGKLTENITDAQLAAANTSKNLQSLSFSFASLASGPIKSFAEQLEKATGVINKIAGVGGTATTPSGVNRGLPGGAAISGNKSVTIGDQVRSGGDRNWRNNNPGNIEYGPFAQSMGAIGSDGRFAIFPTEEMGRKAADTLLKGKAYANLSAAQAINKWAPSNENDPKAYAASIAKQTGLDMSKRYSDMSPAEQSKFLDAMNKVEGGRAGTISGPNGGYKSADIPTASSAGAETTAKSNSAAPAQQASDEFKTQTQLLKEQNDLLRQNNAQNAKLIQQGKA